MRTDPIAFGANRFSPAMLPGAFGGQVITPESAEYGPARQLFYGGFDRRPAAILRAADALDVARVIDLARAEGLELAVRGGGHSAAGHGASDGGIVLDLKNLRSLEIDPHARTAWAGSGLTAGEYTTAAAAHGLATGFGDTGSVGIGGITLGGGIGYLVRKHGLTIDSLLAAEIVTADGQARRADADSEPDLFWAIRGGGGNFGVVTRFKYRLHPLASVVGGILVLPAEPEVIAGFMAASEAAPEALSAIANIMPAPPMPFLAPEHHGKMILFALMVFAGDAEAAAGALAPFRALAAPLADLLRPAAYPEMFPPEEADDHPTAVGRTLFLNRVDAEIAARIVETLQASDAPFKVVQLRALGGAMARVPVEATAFAHRRAPIMANVAAFYSGAEDRAGREAWTAEFAAALRQEEPGTYVNFMGEEGRELIRSAYPGEHWGRLRAIKTRYDPGNLFHLNHNIPPGEG